MGGRALTAEADAALEVVVRAACELLGVDRLDVLPVVCRPWTPPVGTRIQRSRRKGWRMPYGTVYVGRPTVWGNPWQAGPDGTAADVVDRYARWLDGLEAAPELVAGYPRKPPTVEDLQDLVGVNLACWCPLNRPCHADVLLARVAGL